MTPVAAEKFFVTGFVMAIRIERDFKDRSLGTVVEVDYLPSLEQPHDRHTLRFERAINICIRDLDALSLSVLEFMPIRDWGWDRVSYAVEDVENGVVALKCERWCRIGETEGS